MPRSAVLAMGLFVGLGCGGGSGSSPGAADGAAETTDAAASDAGAMAQDVAAPSTEASAPAHSEAGTDATTLAQAEGGPPAASEGGGSVDLLTGGLGQCLAPAGASVADARAAYAQWKSDLVTSDGARGFQRVKRPNSPGAIDTSNSEGTAYGMILAVAMNDQALFDALWQYERLFLDGAGLMNWEISADGSGPTSEGTGAATDADEDMAFALLWADHRWGGRGSLPESYESYALAQIDLIWQNEVDHTRSEAMGPGDEFGTGAADLNISYFAPAYYRLFGAANGKSSDWNKVVESSYTILAATLTAANHDATNGLIPAWSTPAGVPQAPNSSLPTNHQLDSCRVPFRIGQDYCFYGEPRAKDYLAKISAFYQGVGASKLVDGYDLDGTPDPTHPTVDQSAAFVGTAGVGAMSDPAFATLRDQAYAGVATLKELDGSTYYTESWTALSLVMMNGGYWNPGGM